MKLITRKNFFSVYCQVFTIVGLFGTICDMISYRNVNFTQFNIMSIAVGSFLGVLILSQSYRLEHFSPLKIILFEYCVAVALFLALTWCTNLWEPVNPHGYRDVVITFSIPYLAGSILYMYRLKKEIEKQNRDIRLIRELILEKNSREDT